MSVRRAQASVNVAAIERNCARLRARAARWRDAVRGRQGRRLWPWRRAERARRARRRRELAGGGDRARGAQLREAGLREARVLVMGALSPIELAQALAAEADVTVWHERDVQAVAAAGGGRVHVKLDSGMGRLGTRDPAEASRVVAAARGTPGVELAGVMTHFATADELDDDGFFAAQLRGVHALGEPRSGPSSRRPSCTPPTAPRCCATRARTSTWCAAA